MMSEKPYPRDDDGPLDELSPRLRKVVEEIAAEQPPEDLGHQTLSRLRGQGPPTIRSRTRQITIYAGWAVAAGVLLAVSVWLLLPNPAEPDGPTVVSVEPRREPAETTAPNWWSFHQAARRSPEELEALLDRHTHRMALSSPTSFTIANSGALFEETL